MKVTVLNGRGLHCKEFNKDVHPYCVLQTGSSTSQTKPIGSTSDPQWNEEFILEVEPDDSEVLSFSIWHKNVGKRDVVIGYAFVDFGNLAEGERTTINIQLQGIYAGEVKLNIVPLYETTSSKLKRFQRQLTLLDHDESNREETNRLQSEKIQQLEAMNDQLRRANKKLEEERRLVKEYDIVSPTNPNIANSVHQDDGDGRFLSEHCNPDAEEEFDIISQYDIDKASCEHTISGIYSFQGNSHTNSQVGNIAVEGVTPVRRGSDLLRRLCAKVNGLEDENSELQFFIQQTVAGAEKETAEETDNLECFNECQYCGGAIKGDVAQLRHLKYQNDTTITLLKQIISSFADPVIGEGFATIDRDIDDDEGEFDLDSGQYENETVSGEEEGDKTVSLKTLNDQDILSMKEYFWDEYLPISTAPSNEDFQQQSREEIVGKGGESATEDITDDIDEFITNNYTSFKLGTHLLTRSQIMEENNHFKEMNIRLIKENEEVRECMQLLQSQVRNLQQSNCMNGITGSADIQPSCIKDDSFSETSGEQDEDGKLSMYKTNTETIVAHDIECVCEGGDERGSGDDSFKSPSLHHLTPT